MRRYVFAVLVASLVGAAPAPEYDLLLRGGRIVDGSGNPWYVADVGVRSGRIAAVGRLDGARAARVVDARGLVVAPGFIDVHTHVETGIRRRPTADNFVLDGVTTLVTGNCGGSEVDLPTSTYEAPHAPAEGFRYVVVNGELVVDGGQPLGSRPGRVLAPAAVP